MKTYPPFLGNIGDFFLEQKELIYDSPLHITVLFLCFWHQMLALKPLLRL